MSNYLFYSKVKKIKVDRENIKMIIGNLAT